MIKQVLNERLKDEVYEAENGPTLAEELVKKLRTELKGMAGM